jgi:Putative beta barrel porin-7 (BBP7)
MTKPWIKVVAACWATLASVGITLAQPATQPAAPQQESGKVVPSNPIPPPIFPPPMEPCPKMSGPGQLQITGSFPPPETGPIAWASIDYLSLWMRQAPAAPALLTSTAATVANTRIPGAVTDPAASVLIGGDSIGYDGFASAKVTAGLWFNFERDCGFEVSGFLTETRAVGFAAASSALGRPFLGVPFFDVNRNVENVIPLAVPNVQAGGELVSSKAQFGSGEGNFLHPFIEAEGLRVEGMVGFRYFYLSETLGVQEQTGLTANFTGVTPLALNGINNVVFPNVLTYQDQFKTRNKFYGGQVGFRSSWDLDRWFVKVQAELAAGVTDESIGISGAVQQLSAPGGSVVAQGSGGILAQASNSTGGSHTHFAVLPSAEVQVGYELMPNKYIQVGYTFMYLSNVVRPGSQIDRNVNTSQGSGLADFMRFTNSNSPGVPFSTSEFWAHGLEVGLKLTY